MCVFCSLQRLMMVVIIIITTIFHSAPFFLPKKFISILISFSFCFPPYVCLCFPAKIGFSFWLEMSLFWREMSLDIGCIFYFPGKVGEKW